MIKYSQVCQIKVSHILPNVCGHTDESNFKQWFQNPSPIAPFAVIVGKNNLFWLLGQEVFLIFYQYENYINSSNKRNQVTNSAKANEDKIETQF